MSPIRLPIHPCSSESSLHSAFALACFRPTAMRRKSMCGRWSWEIFWMTQAAWCWFLWPVIGAALTIPDLGQVLAEAPKLPMLYCCSDGHRLRRGRHRLQHLHPLHRLLAHLFHRRGPFERVGHVGAARWYADSFGTILAKPGAEWVSAGVVVGAARHRPMRVRPVVSKKATCDPTRRRAASSRSSKGLLLSLVAGILSAVYGLRHAKSPSRSSTSPNSTAPAYWKGNVAYLFANHGRLRHGAGLQPVSGPKEPLAR